MLRATTLRIEQVGQALREQPWPRPPPHEVMTVLTVDATCRACGTPFDATVHGGNRKQYCSERCRRKAEKRRKYEREKQRRLTGAAPRYFPGRRSTSTPDECAEFAGLIAAGLVVLKTCSSCGVRLSPISTGCRKNWTKGGYCTKCQSACVKAWKVKNLPPCDGCGEPTQSKTGTCRYCQRNDRYGQQRCAQCHIVFVAESKRKYCSTSCANARRVTQRDRLELRPCQWCLQEFRPAVHTSRLCSLACRVDFTNHVRSWRAPDRCHIPICRECYQPFGYRTARVSGQMQRCHTCAVVWRRGRQAASGETGQQINLRALWERDGGICHLCKKVVMWNPANVRDRPTRDHLIPVSHGGTHTWDNIALAHHSCNSRRGNRGNVQLRLIS